MKQAKLPQQLPDPPLLVFCKEKGRKKPFWRYSVQRTGRIVFGRFEFPDWVEPLKLKVIDHPLNDQEAVEIIKSAKSQVRNSASDLRA